MLLLQEARRGKFSMNVRHNDDDRPNPAGAAAVAERGGSHDAAHRERRWITAGQCALQSLSLSSHSPEVRAGGW